MRLKTFTLAFAALLVSMGSADAKTIVLTGQNLSIEDALSIAEGEAEVGISDSALKKVQQSDNLVFDAAKAGIPIYGLTVGVGLNKLLNGYTGVQPRVVELYRDMLNSGVTPEIPSHGSIGEADILLASHVGAVMIGDWEAKADGKILSGEEALKSKGLKPLVPIGKDGLGICSNNSVSEAAAIVALKKAEQAIKVTPIVYSLSLEGLNGVVAPFIKQSVAARGTEGLSKTSKLVAENHEGSYLWQANDKRALQDPLSFRTTVHGLT